MMSLILAKYISYDVGDDQVNINVSQMLTFLFLSGNSVGDIGDNKNVNVFVRKQC